MNLKNKLIYAIAGFLIGNVLLLSLIFGLNYFLKTDSSPAQEISLDKAYELIKSNQIKEVAFSNSQAILIDADDNKYLAKIGSDPTRESLLGEINKVNEGAATPRIAVTEETVGSGFEWLILLNLFPVVILLIFGITVIGLLTAILLKLNKNQKLNP